MSSRAVLGGALGVASAAAFAWACLRPTQITLQLTTDVTCADLLSTSIYNGSASGADAIPFTTTTDCTEGVTRTIGTLVLAPSGSKSDTVTVTIVAGVKVRSETCTSANNFRECIVARRKVRYSEHQPLEVSVFLANACRGIVCPDGQTCVPCEKEPCTVAATPLCAPLAAVDVCDQPGSNCAPAPAPVSSGDGASDVPTPPVAPPRDAEVVIDAAGSDGGVSPFRLLVSSPEQVYGLGVEGQDLYWTRNQQLWKANLASLLVDADAGVTVAAPGSPGYRGVDVVDGAVALALADPTSCGTVFYPGGASATRQLDCPPSPGRGGRGILFAPPGSGDVVLSTAAGLSRYNTDGGIGAPYGCTTSYLRGVRVGSVLTTASGVSDSGIRSQLGFSGMPGVCLSSQPGPPGETLVALAITPNKANYVTTLSGVVYKQALPGAPWVPLGTLTGTEDLLAVSPGNSNTIHLLVAAKDGIWIAENLPEP
ncbi:MAG: hypothetical protein IPG50_11060 [Myxococcales bacterium]|nr:hypothetical protein [Myxococcales bacterium]